VDAVAQNRQLKFTYHSRQGNSKERIVSPQGLVAKDGTVYLLATEGLSDIPKFAYALHRMTEATVHHQQCQARPDFDLDKYIHDTAQLSHAQGANTEQVTLTLRVAPEALFHFAERPLSTTQTIGPPQKLDGWYQVQAQVPVTLLLVPFLLSLGEWIEVMEPPSIRKEITKWARNTSALYRDDPVS
jgi:predicted DNA-binding transcriptional regulator YafY